MFNEAAKIAVILVLFMAHCGLIGRAALSVLCPAETVDFDGLNRYLVWFFAICVGLLVNLATLFGLGMVGWLSPSLVLTLGSGLGIVSAVLLRRLPLQQRPGYDVWTWTDSAILAAVFVIVFMSCMHAPGYWDDTMYHLPLARWYLEHGAITLDPYVRFPLFPQNINLLITLGLMVGGDFGAQAFASLPLFVMALGMLGASLWISGSVVMGTLAFAALLMIGPVRGTLGYAYIDNGLALFCLSATLALAIWLQSAPERRSAHGWLVIAGLLAGGAAGSKYFGVVLGGLLAGYLLVSCRDWRACTIFCAAMAASGSAWYVRSFLISGDPIHPAGGNIFGHYLWNAADLLSQQQEQATHGVRPSSFRVFEALRSAGAWPMVLAFGCLLIPNLPTVLRCMRFIFMSYVVFWFFVTQVDRYLAPVYGVAMLLVLYVPYAGWQLVPASLLAENSRHRLAAMLAHVVIAMTLGAMSWRSITEGRRALANWHTTLEQRPGFQLLSKANSLTDQYGSTLVQLGFENAVYFFHGNVIGDWFGPGRYSQMLSCDATGCGPVEPWLMVELMQHFNAKMFALSTARFSRFDRQSYEAYFTIVMTDRYGVLMTVKTAP